MSIALRGKLNTIWTGKNVILGEGLGIYNYVSGVGEYMLLVRGYVCV